MFRRIKFMKRSYLSLMVLVFLISIAAVSASEDTNQTLSMSDIESPDAEIVSLISSDISSHDNLTLGENENGDMLAGADTSYVNLSQPDGSGNVNLSVSDSKEINYNNPSINVNITSKIENAKETIGLEIGDFDQLQMLINNASENSVIDLACNYTYNEFDTITDGVLINKNLTINGNGFTIDAKGKSRIFYVTAGSLNIINATLKNGYADYGGAFYFENSIYASIINATFINNSADWGGANFFNNALSASEVTGLYINNSADYGATSYFRNISDSEVSGLYINNSADYGAASYFREVSSSAVTGIYINNSATGSGVNYFRNKASDSWVTGLYIDNDADDVIYFYGTVTNVNVTDAIFLNNDGNNAIYSYGTGVLAANNWFGSNATNYINKPRVSSKIEMDTWLFLNGTADPDRLFGINTSDITFKLYLYNSSGISEYDGGFLGLINLTVSSRNGNLSKSIVKLGETIKFTSNGSAGAEITAQVENAFHTVKIGVKGDFELLQDLINNAGENSVINLGRNYTYNENDTISDGVVISKNLTINGNGFTIDAKGKSRIFYVTAGSVNICDVTLKNGDAEFGGAVYFKNPISDSIINATYINNSAVVGAANYFVDSVSACDISGLYIANTAYLGSAIYFDDDISACDISGLYIANTADREDGGVICIVGDALDSTLTGAYINNSAYEIIYFGYGPLSVNLSNAIFLNNDCTYVIDADSRGVVADNNWFGNNAENYMDNPKVGNKIKMNTWLFLNGTANSTMLFRLDTSDITFKLYSYSSSGISEYDEALLSPINLTVSATKGNLSKSIVKLGETVIFTPNSGGTAKITAQAENAMQTVEIRVKGDFDLLQELINNASENSVINLTRNYTYSELDMITDGVSINKILTINGNGFTIDAKGKSRIFYVIPEYFNITDVTLKNGYADYGGALYFKNYIFNSVINATFINNTADYGGAVYFYSGVTNSEVNGLFINNTADYGAADYFNKGVSGSTISGLYINNTAGELIYFYGSIANVNVRNAIFLNNDCTYAIDSRQIGVAAEGNWFGNNATDYSNKPKVGDNIEMTKWLFLNATADSRLLLVLDSSEIVFRLYSYGSSGISDYDNSKLPQLNLTLTAIKGDIANTTALDKSVEYRATQSGEGSVTASIENAVYTILLDNNKRDANLSVIVEPDEIGYGENASIILDYNATATGTVNITLTGKKYNRTFENVDLKRTIPLPANILPDEYEVNVIYSGDEIFENATAESVLTVNRLKSDIKVEGYDINVTDINGVMFTATLPENATGIITVSNGLTVNVTEEGIKEKGFLIINIANGAYAVGEYVWSFSYLGDDIYENSTAEATSNILIIKTEITAKTDFEIFVDDKAQISYTLTPADAVGNITFASNDTGVITVDENGEITAVAEGTAKVTVTFEGSENYTQSNASLAVVVSRISTEIKVINDTFDLKVNDIVSDFAVLLPEEASGLTYTSSNENVAVVTSGTIVAVGEGEAIITVSYGGNYKYLPAENRTLKVTVTLIETSVSTKNDTLNLVIGDKYVINATAEPDGLAVHYNSSDESVVCVDENGTVTAVGEGSAVITLSVGDGLVYAISTATVKVNVAKIPTEITVLNDTVALNVNDMFEISANLTPAGAGNLTYTSSNESVVKVENGKVIAVGAGEAIITVSFAGDDTYAACENKTIEVTVSLNDASVSVENDTLNLYVDDGFTLNPVTVPSGLNVTFESSNPDVASVSALGKVAAHSEGTAVITIKVGGDGVYALNSTTVTVKVSKIPTEITLENETLDLKVNDIVEITANLAPEGAGNITYTSSDVDIVMVADGVVVASGKGTAVITLSFAGNDRYAACENKTIIVTVTLWDAQVSVENDTLDLIVDDRFDLNASTLPSSLNVEYSSDNESVVTVNQYGIVTAVGEGTAVITLSVGDDKVYARNSTTVTVNVAKIPTEITVLNDTVALNVNDIFVISANLTPADAGNLSYTSSNESVVKVEDGRIVAVGAGSATVTVSFAGDDKYADAENKTIDVTVSLNDASVSVLNDTLNLFVGDDYTVIAVTVPEGLNVTFTSSDESVVTVDEYGTVTALKAGNAIITLVVGDGMVYALNSTTVSVIVTRITPDLSVSADAITYGEALVVKVTSSSDISRRVTVTVGNESKFVSLKDGVGSVKFSGLNAGSHVIEVSYNGDAVYAKASVNTTVKVNKATPTIKATVNAIAYGENLVVEVKLSADVTRRAVVTIEGVSKYVSLTDGLGSVKFKGLSVGVHTVEISYGGDANYKKASINKTVRVNRAVPAIKVTAPSVDYGEDLVVNVTMPSDVTRRAKVIIDGNITKMVSLKDGVGSVKFSGLAVGVHDIQVTYDGDANYLNSSANKTVMVNRVVPTINITAPSVDYGEDLVVNVTMPCDITRRAKVIIDGNITKLVSLKDGVGSVKFGGLEVGLHDIEVIHEGDSNYKSSSANKTVMVTQ